MSQQASSVLSGNSERNRHRPSPFGPAWALLPKDQQPLVLDGATAASDAIKRLIDNGYSQIPVKDNTGQIIGVFSWKSFGKPVVDLQATRIKPTELPIRDCVEPARFMAPDHLHRHRNRLGRHQPCAGVEIQELPV